MQAVKPKARFIPENGLWIVRDDSGIVSAGNCLANTTKRFFDKKVERQTGPYFETEPRNEHRIDPL